MDERTADDERTAQARKRLESLDSDSDDEFDGDRGLKKTQSGGSLLDDLVAWWDDLDMEAWVKTALDDMETLFTGSQTLKSVALCPGADWQPDDARGTCNLCDNPFTFTRRRHHCRHCGLLFCNDCADHFMYLTQNKVRFKFRICADCKDDEATAENIRENGAMALDSVTQVAQTMGREAKKQREAGNEVNLPNTTKLMVALGMEDGEELTFAHGDAPVETSSALVAQMDDPWDDAWWQDDGTEKDHFAAEGTMGGEGGDWWEDTFFDGSFSQASRGDDYRYGTTASVSSEHLMGSMGQQERFLSYNDFAGDSPEPEPALGGLGGLDGSSGSGGGAAHGLDGPLGGPIGGGDVTALPEPIE